MDVDMDVEDLAEECSAKAALEWVAAVLVVSAVVVKRVTRLKHRTVVYYRFTNEDLPTILEVNTCLEFKIIYA